MPSWMVWCFIIVLGSGLVASINKDSECAELAAELAKRLEGKE